MKTTAAAIFIIMSSGISSVIQAAPLTDITVKASYWQADYSGELGSGGQIAKISELGFTDKDQNVITLELRHAVPVLPNIRIQDTGLQADASGTLTRQLVFNDQTFSASTDVDTDLDLSHTDVTLFYSPVDNWITVDVGITARYFQAKAMVSSSTLEAKEVLDEWIPMGHLGLGIELPMTDFYVGTSINAIGYQGNNITDVSLLIGYQASVVAGVDLITELGYRDFSVEVDDNDFEGDVKVDGIYVTLGITF